MLDFSHHIEGKEIAVTCPHTVPEDETERFCESLSRFTQPPVQCVSLSIGVYERMKLDQRKFGKSSWTAAVERMERLRYSVAKETLQLQRAREICLEQRKHTLREEVW